MLAGIVAKDRSLERAAWRLWWQGFAIDHRLIRPPIERLLALLSENAAEVRRIDNGDDDEADQAYLDQLEFRARGRSRDSAFRRTRKRVGKTGMLTHLVLVSRIAAGVFEHGDSTDANILMRAVGGRTLVKAVGPHQDEVPSLLRHLSTALDPLKLQTAYAAADEPLFNSARDEIRPVLPLVGLAADFFGLPARDGASLRTWAGDLENQQLMLLGWLAWRDNTKAQLLRTAAHAFTQIEPARWFEAVQALREQTQEIRQ
jgi:hypothetical protein